VKIPVWTYLWQTWVRSALVVVPFATACALAERYWPAHNLFVFFLQISALLILLPFSLLLVFRDEVLTKGREWRKKRSQTPGPLGESYEPVTTSAR
jgi:hypothetical protein